MPWNAIYNCIPKRVINHFKNNSKLDLKEHNYIVRLGSKWKELHKLKSREVTQYLKSRITEKKDLSKFLQDTIKVTPTGEHDELFKRLTRVTEDVKTNQFNFKLLHGILYLNKRLFQWKIVQSPRCSFCYLQLETVSHLFLQCIEVQHLWKGVEDWWNSKGPKDGYTKFTDEVRMIGVPLAHRYSALINTLVMECKMSIFHGRARQTAPPVEVVLCALKRRSMTEKSITRRQKSINVIRDKWSPLSEALEQLRL